MSSLNLPLKTIDKMREKSNIYIRKNSKYDLVKMNIQLFSPPEFDEEGKLVKYFLFFLICHNI